MCSTITNDNVSEKHSQEVCSFCSQDYQTQNREIFFPPLKSSNSAKKKKKKRKRKKSTDFFFFFFGIREQSSDRSTTN